VCVGVKCDIIVRE